MLIKYSNGMYIYCLATHGLVFGSFIKSSAEKEGLLHYELGYSIILINIPLFSTFYNIELKPKSKIIYCRAAGTFCKNPRWDEEKQLHVIILPTGKIIKISSYCLITLGRVANLWNNKIVIGAAGYRRLNGVRPTVRGVAMNPVDHPHGGRTKTNKPEVTPWGRIAKKR